VGRPRVGELGLHRERPGANCSFSREPALHRPRVKGCAYTLVGTCVTWHL
jgi:hypothetical protein